MGAPHSPSLTVRGFLKVQESVRVLPLKNVQKLSKNFHTKCWYSLPDVQKDGENSTNTQRHNLGRGKKVITTKRGKKRSQSPLTRCNLQQLSILKLLCNKHRS